MVAKADQFSWLELIGLTLSLGVFCGAVGINFAHELVHQSSRVERAAGEILLTSVLYPHFRIEHVYGHHLNVATPEDPATARFGESYYAFLPRTLSGSLRSALQIEAEFLRRRGLSPFALENRFWRYGSWVAAALCLAFVIGGPVGFAVFLIQAATAVALLEATNYVEHYGLERRKLDDGRYERTQPHHSWNASPRISNWMLINLQRHSDHHHRADRRYPLLRNYDENEAPQLPFGYPVMTLLALVPPLWFSLMNPRVEAWRARFAAPQAN